MKYSAIILTFLAASSYGQFVSGEKVYPVTSEGPLADFLNQLQPRQPNRDRKHLSQ